MPGTMQLLLCILLKIIAMTFKSKYCYIPFAAEDIKIHKLKILLYYLIITN